LLKTSIIFKSTTSLVKSYAHKYNLVQINKKHTHGFCQKGLGFGGSVNPIADRIILGIGTRGTRDSNPSDSLFPQIKLG